MAANSEIENHRCEKLQAEGFSSGADEQIGKIWSDALDLVRCERASDAGGGLSPTAWEDSAAVAVEQTEEIIAGLVDSLVGRARQAYGNASRSVEGWKASEEVSERRGREIERLRGENERSRATIKNLQRTFENSRSGARESVRSIAIESRLRTEVTNFRAELESSNSSRSELKRRYSLVSEELQLTKTRLERVSQEKLKVERDSRASISLTRSLESHATSDGEFYKRKVADLSERMQSQQHIILEQKKKD